jgi:hypothetical protein
MTKPARISYADILRTMKAIKAAGIEKARVTMRLGEGEIEVVIGGGQRDDEVDAISEWSDDDV